MGRARFAQSLAETIRDWDRDESIVIALYGSWGSGKTSLLNLVIEHIEKTSRELPTEKRPIIIRFDPWNFTDPNTLLMMFFHELFLAIRTVAPDKGQEILENLNWFANALSLLENVPVVDNTLANAGKLLQLLTSENSLDDKKKSIGQRFKALDRRIIIVLDDIDRLTQDEIRHVFRLIKLNADFPNTIYLVAFAREVVERALTTEQGISGREYLEKIVQVGFDVPPVDAVYISQFLTGELDKVLSSVPDKYWDPIRWGNLFNAGFKSLFTTLRDVKRFINGLAFNFRIVSGEVNPIDFIGLEALRIFVPEVYSGIAGNKTLFTQRSRFGRTPLNPDSLRQQYEGILAKAEEAHREIAKNVCLQLFPQMSVAYPKTFRGSDRQRDWRKARRICAEEIFDFYFLLGTPKGDISRSELQLVTQLSNEPDRLTAILKDMMREGRLPRLLELVGDVIDELDEVGVRGFCQSLLEMGDELPNYQSSSIDLGTDIQIAMLAYQALQRLTQEERCLWLHDQISSGPSLFMPAYIVFQSEPPKGKPEEELLFSEKCLISLEAACVQKIAARAELGQLQNMKNLPYILFRWRKWADDEKPVQHFIETMLKTPVTALELLAGFMWQGSKYTYGDYVEQREWQLNLEDLSKFVDLKRLESLLMPISEQDAGVKSERHRLALVEFRNALQGKMSSASFAEEE